MIVDNDEFLDIVEQKTFIGDKAIQDQLFWFAFNRVSIDKLTVLWLIQQAYNVSFSHVVLEASYLELATVEELLEGLVLFHFKPTSFIEAVLNKGSSEQIEKLNAILEGLTNE